MQTFVVRTYVPGRDDDQDDGRLRGVVEEVATGFRATFHDTSELMSILHRRRRPTSGAWPAETDAEGKR
jgi:hypothetical protein